MMNEGWRAQNEEWPAEHEGWRAFIEWVTRSKMCVLYGTVVNVP